MVVISTRPSRTDPNLLQSLLDESSRAFLMVDASTGTVIDANSRANELIDADSDALVDTSIEDFLSCIDSPISWDEFVSRLRQEESLTVREEFSPEKESRLPVRLSLELVGHNGSDYVLLFAERLNRGDSAAPGDYYREFLEKLSVPCVLNDLSRVREDLNSDRLPPSDADDYLTDNGLEVVNDRTETVTTNKRFDNLIEPNDASVNSSALFERLPDDDVEELFRNLFSGQKSIRMDTVIRTRMDGDVSVTLVALIPPEMAESWSRVFVMLQDLPESVQIKRQETPVNDTFEQITDNIEQVVWMFDSKMENLLLQTGPTKDIYGCKPDDIQENPRVLFEMIHPEDRSRVEAAIESMVEGEAIDVEYRANPGEGFNRWVWTQGIPIENEVGNVQRIVGFTKDITERKRMKSSLRETKERYRSFFEQAQVGLAEVTIDGRWRRVNERLCEILGYSKDELQERTCSSMTHPEDLETDRRKGQQLLDGEIDKYSHEKRFFTKSGDTVWVRHTSSMVRNEEGEPQYYLTVVQDIDEQREAEEALKRREQLYRDLVSDVPGIVYRCLADDSWTMRFLNDKVETITGYPREDLLEDKVRSYRSLIHPEDRERVRTRIEDSIEQGEAFEVEYRITAADDEIRWLLGRGRAIDSTEDDVPILHGVIVDVTERKRTQQKLEKSEKRYRALFEQAAVGMAYVDLDGKLLRANEKFCELLGYDREQLQRKSFQEVTHPEDLEKDLDNLESLKQGERDQYSIEKRYIRADGSVFWAQLTVGVVRDAESNPEYFVSVIEDISERKEAEEELRRSEEKFRELAENIDEIFWLTDADKDEMLYVSPNVDKVFDVEPEAFYDNPDGWLEYVHPEDQSRVRKDLLQRQKEGDYDEEFRVILPDGSIRWVRDRAFPIKNDQGKVQRIAGIVEDITKEKRIQEEQETFFNLSLDLFALADYDGKFLDVNPAFTETLGYSRSELTSKSFLEFVHPEDVEKTKNAVKKLENDQSVIDFVNRYITKDGDVRWLSWRAEPGDDMVYNVARDVTEQRKYEQRLQDMIEEKETLLKEIHHRVKNNLQMISSLLDMQMREIEREDLTEKLRDSVNRIKSMALIHENLYQSENLADLNFTRYIQELTERTLNVHQKDPSSISLNYEVDKDPLELDRAIPCGLVLNELISNALEHGFESQDEGTVRITFRNKGDLASLVVRDDGCGFESEFDVEETDTFGMQIVRSLVEYELDGEISFYNDNGAVVDITFPL